MDIDFNRQPKNTKIFEFHLPRNTSRENEEIIRNAIWRQIVMGQVDGERFRVAVVDAFEEREIFFPFDLDNAAQAGADLLGERRYQQSALPEQPKTYLQKAFVDLNKNHQVIAVQNFTCCDHCGHAEIRNLIDEYVAKFGAKPIGYVFFHQQDVENIIDNKTTHLSYGAFTPIPGHEELSQEEANLWILNEVVLPVLQQYGISATWDGTPLSRPELYNVNYVYYVPTGVSSDDLRQPGTLSPQIWP